MRKSTLTNHTICSENIFGWIWLIAQQLVAPLPIMVAFILLRVPNMELWTNMAFFAINFLLTLVVFHRFLKKSCLQFFKRIGRCIGFSALGYAMFSGSNMILSLLIYLLFPDFANANDEYISILAGNGYWLMLLGTVVLVPIAEEVIYRGVVFGSIYRKNRVLAYIVSAVIFSSIHVAGYILTESPQFLLISFLQYLPAGLILAWVYVKTDSIIPPLMIHTLNNLLGMLAMR